VGPEIRGQVRTRILETLSEENIEYLRSRIPMDRFGDPVEVAALVHYLVSGMCTFTTGFCFDMSGGRSTY